MEEEKKWNSREEREQDDTSNVLNGIFTDDDGRYFRNVYKEHDENGVGIGDGEREYIDYPLTKGHKYTFKDPGGKNGYTTAIYDGTDDNGNWKFTNGQARPEWYDDYKSIESVDDPRYQDYEDMLNYKEYFVRPSDVYNFNTGLKQTGQGIYKYDKDIDDDVFFRSPEDIARSQAHTKNMRTAESFGNFAKDKGFNGRDWYDKEYRRIRDGGEYNPNIYTDEYIAQMNKIEDKANGKSQTRAERKEARDLADLEKALGNVAEVSNEVNNVIRAKQEEYKNNPQNAPQPSQNVPQQRRGVADVASNIASQYAPNVQLHQNVAPEHPQEVQQVVQETPQEAPSQNKGVANVAQSIASRYMPQNIGVSGGGDAYSHQDVVSEPVVQEQPQQVIQQPVVQQAVQEPVQQSQPVSVPPAQHKQPVQTQQPQQRDRGPKIPGERRGVAAVASNIANGVVKAVGNVFKHNDSSPNMSQGMPKGNGGVVSAQERYGTTSKNEVKADAPSTANVNANNTAGSASTSSHGYSIDGKNCTDEEAVNYITELYSLSGYADDKNYSHESFGNINPGDVVEGMDGICYGVYVGKKDGEAHFLWYNRNFSSGLTAPLSQSGRTIKPIKKGNYGNTASQQGVVNSGDGESFVFNPNYKDNTGLSDILASKPSDGKANYGNVEQRKDLPTPVNYLPKRDEKGNIVKDKNGGVVYDNRNVDYGIYRKPQTFDEFRAAFDANEEKLAKESDRRAKIAAIGDALRHLGNLGFTIGGAAPQEYRTSPAMTERQQYMQERQQRENNMYKQFQLKQNAEIKRAEAEYNRRKWEAQLEGTGLKNRELQEKLYDYIKNRPLEDQILTAKAFKAYNDGQTAQYNSYMAELKAGGYADVLELDKKIKQLSVQQKQASIEESNMRRKVAEKELKNLSSTGTKNPATLPAAEAGYVYRINPNSISALEDKISSVARKSAECQEDIKALETSDHRLTNSELLIIAYAHLDDPEIRRVFDQMCVKERSNYATNGGTKLD